MDTKIQKFTDLIAWQKGHQLVLDVYKITRTFPSEERFGLTSQTNRAVVSITNNIAEGFSRYHYKDRVRFYYFSRGSISELVNLLIIAKDLNYLQNEKYIILIEHCQESIRLVNGLINKTLEFCL